MTNSAQLAQVNTVAAVATLQASFAAVQAGIAQAAAQSILTAATSWTPIDGSGGTNSLVNVSAQYLQVGNIVIAQFRLTYPGTVSGGSDNATIGALPVAVPNNVFANSVSGCLVSGMGTPSAVSLVTVPNTSTAQFFNPVTQANITNTQLAGATVWCSLQYTAV